MTYQPQQQHQQPPSYQTASYQGYAPMPPQRPSSGLAITSLVTGILGFLSLLFPFVAIPLGIVAVITGIVALRGKQHQGMSLAGLILGGLALVLNIGLTIWMFVPGGLLDQAANA